jgi:hypothetical protein
MMLSSLKSICCIFNSNKRYISAADYPAMTKGKEYCGARESVPTASICARNSSAAFDYANTTLRPFLGSFSFVQTPFSFVGK